MAITKRKGGKYANLNKHALKNGYHSGLEESICNYLKLCNVNYKYEPYQVEYIQVRNYTPDILLLDSNILIEIKGEFSGKDRTKHLLVKAQNPKLDIRFVFSNPYRFLSDKTTTTYAQWCDKNGFKWAYGSIPDDWIKEVKK